MRGVRPAAALAALAMLSCSDPAKVGAGLAPGKAAAVRRPLVLGVVIFGPDSWSEGVLAGMRKAALEKGARLQERAHDHDIVAESQAIGELVALKVDVLLVTAEDPDASVASLRAAATSGIKVVCVGTCLNEEDAAGEVAAFYESDPTMMGYRTGSFLTQWASEEVPGRLKVGIFNCDRFPAGSMRSQGFRAALDDAGVAWTEVANQEAFVRDTAVKVARQILQRHPDVDVLWAANEGGTEGAVDAVRAVRKEHLAGRVRVFGTDISTRLRGMLKDRDDILQAVTAQVPNEIGYQAVLGAVELAQGRKPAVRQQLVSTPFYSRSRAAVPGGVDEQR
ncbi:MAG TPA: substrate-binding domain-containing protein [Thermoanaerobaculia bacterium]|nr:substrate-binding domain-containing protein [Thermoanaerobaculia bacterium]